MQQRIATSTTVGIVHALWWVLAATLMPAYAQSPINCHSPELLVLEADALGSHLEHCQKDPAYLARLGQLYNQQQRYAQAAEHLERALLLEPDNPNTQLDYAIALAGSGDIASALHLVQALQQHPDLPASLRLGLLHTSRQWANNATEAQVVPHQVTRMSAGVRMGYDNNLLGSPRLSSLALTLPTETITLPVDQSNHPRSGTFVRTDLHLSHSRLQPDGSRWAVDASALQRNSPGLNAANSTQAELQLEYIQPAPGYYASATLAALDAHTGTRYISQGITAGIERSTLSTVPRCTQRLGLEWQNRQLHNNEVLSGQYSGVSGHWGCAPPGKPQWQLTARVGQDRPRDASRPGGAQDQYNLRARVSTHTSPASFWLLDAEASYSRDASGYSALLDHNRRRSITRLSLRAEYQYTISPSLRLLAGADALVQNASLPLFALRSRGLYLGVRAHW